MSRFEIKIVAALLLIAILPLTASVFLVEQVIRVSNSVAEGQANRLSQSLDRSAQAYRDLFAARKRVFSLQGKFLARDPLLQQLLECFVSPDDDSAAQAREAGTGAWTRAWIWTGTGAGGCAEDQLLRKTLVDRLNYLTDQEPELGLMEVIGPDRSTLARSHRIEGFSPNRYRDLTLTIPVGSRKHQLRLVFFTPRAPFDDFAKLGQTQGTMPQLSKLREELTRYYGVVFLGMFGAVLLVATGLGIFIARRTTRRVAVLAAATQKVADGDMNTRVHFRTKDELGKLAGSFNEMVDQINESRDRIAYLEKIGAWQEIARRLAHEIKNPLTPIQLAVQQLQSKYQGEDPAFDRLLAEAADIITEEVNSLRRLVHAFSAFAKLPNVQPEPLEINGLVDDFFKSHIEIQQQADIDWTPLEDPPKIRGDRMLIKHVLLNLMQNAVEAMEESGAAERPHISLRLHVEHARQRVRFEIQDNGPGMDPETARRAFDPYFTTKGKGTGLGLAIIKKIILEHGGSISVATQRGEGACFTFYLPLVLPPVARTKANSRSYKAVGKK